MNDEEVRQLAGVRNVSRAARAVLAMGPKKLVVKRGEYGALLFDSEGTFFVPAYPLEDEIDPTGAGDSFAGALLGVLAESGSFDHRTLRRALHTASTVASFCVEGVGHEGGRRPHTRRRFVRARPSLRVLVHPGDARRRRRSTRALRALPGRRPRRALRERA